MIKLLRTSVILTVLVLSTTRVWAYEYADALKTFDRDGIGLWLRSPLAEKMSKLRDGVAVVIFDEIWKDGCSVVECDFFEEKYRIHKADNTTTPISKAEFTEMCSAPALVSYDDKVYLNIPSDETARGCVSGTLGQLLAPGVYDVMKSFVKALPRRKIRVKLISKGNPDLILTEGIISDTILRTDVSKAVREMLTTLTKRAWMKEHDAKVKKLPRKPPVVYGTRNIVVKRSDGTFEIPQEAPPKSKTITWTETVYADGWGTTDYGEHFTIRVPIGERECSREKPLTQMYNYDELVAMKEEYESAIEKLKNDRPPEVDEASVEEVLKSGRLRIVVVN